MNSKTPYAQARSPIAAEDFQRVSRRLQALGLNRTSLSDWLGVSQQAVSKWSHRGVSNLSKPAVAAALARPIGWIESGIDWKSDLALDFNNDRVFWRNAASESFSVQLVPGKAAVLAELDAQYLALIHRVFSVVKGPLHALSDELTLVDYLNRESQSPNTSVEQRPVMRYLQPTERFKRDVFEPDLVVTCDGKLLAAIAVRAVTRWVNSPAQTPAYPTDSDQFNATTDAPKKYIATADFPEFSVRSGDILTVESNVDSIRRGLYVLRTVSGAEETFFIEPPVTGSQFTVYPTSGSRSYPAIIDWLLDHLVGRVVSRCGPVP